MSVDFDVVDALAGFAEDLHSEGNFALRLHDAVKKLKEERDALKADLDAVDSDLQLAVKRLNAEVMRLHEENARLKAALERVTDACDPECYGCGAYYLANEALLGGQK